MEFQVNTNNVILAQINQVESGEYNVTECRFIFSSEYEGLTKIAVFTGANGDAYKITILNNKCEIPSELLTESQIVQIGVYAYEVQGKEFILRYSPMSTRFMIEKGSYVVNAVNMSRPTPTEVEQLQSQITHNANDIEDLQQTVSEHTTDISNIQSDINDIKAEQTEQNTNIQKNTDDIVNINQAIDAINTDITDIDSAIGDINEDIDNLEQDLTNYSLITETGSQINLNVNSTNYQITAILKDKNGNVIYTSNAIDLPIESMIVNARYDNTTKEIVLTLQNGNTLRISVADLVSGLVSETQLQTILANYYNKTEVDNLLTNLAGRVSTNEEDIADIKEEQTTQNTNIEELQNQVETLQEDLDNANSEIEELNTDITNMRKAMITVEGQGTDITLENTSENKFVEFGLEGRTEQDGEPTPETPIPIKNVTGNANIKIQNKNLLNIADGNTLTTKSFDITDFVEVGKTYSFSAYLDLKNTTSTAQARLRIDKYIGTEVSYLGGTLVANKSKGISKRENVTLESSVTKVVLTIQSYGVADFNCDYSQIMGEQGSTATSYVPHQEQNYSFTLGDIELNQIGKYQDYFYKKNGKWYLHKEIDKVVFNGSSNVDVWDSATQVGTSSFYRFANSAFNDTTKYKSLTPYISDKFIFDNVNSLQEKNIISNTGVSGANRLWITIDTTLMNGTTVDDFETWLSTHNTEAYCQLATPTDIKITDITLINQLDAIKNAKSYDDITYITSEGDELSFDMNVVAVADANKVIDNQNNEIDTIKSRLDLLEG